MNLKEAALKHVDESVRNISELDSIPVDIDVFDFSGTTQEGKDFSYKYVEFEGIKYRIPGIVLGSLKSIIEKMPDVTHVTVDKKGEGLKTKYTVLPDVRKQK
jgi:hypothetical protein